MYNNSSSKVVPIILIIVAIVISVVALVSAGRVIFGGEDLFGPKKVDVGREALLNTSDEYSVSMTIRGPIVSNEEFQSYNVEIGPEGRIFTVYSGYLDSLTKVKKYTNNEKAYEEFVFALDRNNFMKGNEPEGDKNDTRGICSTGKVYEYKILKDDQPVKSLWTTSCNGVSGSLKAKSSRIEKLFIGQIPDSKEMLGYVDF